MDILTPAILTGAPLLLWLLRKPLDRLLLRCKNFSHSFPCNSPGDRTGLAHVIGLWMFRVLHDRLFGAASHRVDQYTVWLFSTAYTGGLEK